MGTQENIFLDGEGDAWFDRNFYKVEDRVDDPVIDALKLCLSPHTMFEIALEFGCGNGRRLNEIYQQKICRRCYGLDPSGKAIFNGTTRFPEIRLSRGTVTAHPFHFGQFEVVIYGFCLYVCDPEDLCEIVAQGNNILRDQGYLIIHDFDPDYPHCVPNHHVDGLMTYKMDYSKLWLANPAYKLVAKTVIPDGTAVWLLKKDQQGAFPCLNV